MQRAHWSIYLLRIQDKLRCESDEKPWKKPKFVARSRVALYFSQQLSSTRDQKNCRSIGWSRKVTNGETWTQNLQREKLRVFLSRISPPLNREFQNSRRWSKSTWESRKRFCSLSKLSVYSVKMKKKNLEKRKSIHRLSRSPGASEYGHLRFLFCRTAKMYKELKPHAMPLFYFLNLWFSNVPVAAVFVIS